MVRLLSVVAITALAAASSAGERPPVQGQVTFLYFSDLARADAFYGEILGLEKTFDRDWVKIYELSATSSVGLVNAKDGAHRPSADKPVMVSMVVDEEQVDAWWDYLKSRDVDVGEDRPVADDGDVPIRGFGFKDPEGYTLEVFAWLDK